MAAMTFSQALRNVADDPDSELSTSDRRRIKRILDNPRRTKRCEERCEREARKKGKRLRAMGDVYNGVEGEVYGFDWSGLLAFIKELLPLILQLISMF